MWLAENKCALAAVKEVMDAEKNQDYDALEQTCHMPPLSASGDAPMPEQNITLSIEGTLENAVLLATVVQSVAMTLPFSQTDACMLRFCTFEAVKLAIRGHAPQQGSPITVQVDILDDCLRLTVTDMGSAVDFLDACIPDLSVEDIVKAVEDDCLSPDVIRSTMDSVEVVRMDGENRLVMSKIFNTNLREYDT